MPPGCAPVCTLGLSGCPWELLTGLSSCSAELPAVTDVLDQHAPVQQPQRRRPLSAERWLVGMGAGLGLRTEVRVATCGRRLDSPWLDAALVELRSGVGILRERYGAFLVPGEATLPA